jgi:hypothetical protein
MTWSARPSTDGGIVRPSALYSSEQFSDQKTERRRQKREQGHQT